jgi:hypothetical protein
MSYPRRDSATGYRAGENCDLRAGRSFAPKSIYCVADGQVTIMAAIVLIRPESGACTTPPVFSNKPVTNGGVEVPDEYCGKSPITDVMVNAAGVKHGGRTQHLGAASNRHRPARQGENTFARPYISGMKTYRLDPKNPPRLTDEEARRLDETPIDYSDIPELGDEFFSRAKHPPEKLAASCWSFKAVLTLCPVVEHSSVVVALWYQQNGRPQGLQGGLLKQC